MPALGVRIAKHVYYPREAINAFAAYTEASVNSLSRALEREYPSIIWVLFPEQSSVPKLLRPANLVLGNTKSREPLQKIFFQ